MGANIRDAVRRETKRGKPRLVIDFFYVDKENRKQRYRKAAAVQTVTAARAEAKRLQAQAATHGTLEVQESVVTFSTFVETTYKPAFLARHKPGTRKRYEALLRQGVTDHFGSTPLDKIGDLQFRGYAVLLAARGAERSLRHHWSFVRAVLHAAVDSGKLVKMPDLPKLPPMPKKLPEGPSLAEIDKLVSVATGWVRTAAALAGYAGLRSGEVRALRRGDVDLVTGTIRVRRAFSENELVEEPKDGEERIIPIAPPLRPVLVEAVRDKLPGAFLVITGQGRTPTRQRVYAAIVDLQRRHELPHRSFHANRHGFLSELARRKGSIEAIRLLAGHAKLETTQRYLHATADDLRETIALLGGAPVEPPNSSAS